MLPTAEQLGAMVDAGMSQREVAAPFGVSLGKVNGVLRARAAAPAPGTGGRGRPVLRAGGRRWWPRPGPSGLTIPQVQRRLGWTYGATSGALSRPSGVGWSVRPAAPGAARRVPPVHGSPLSATTPHRAPPTTRAPHRCSGAGVSLFRGGA